MPVQQGFQLGEFNRPRVIIALAQITARFTQDGLLLLGFDALADNFEAECFGDLDNAANDHDAFALGQVPLHKAAVEELDNRLKDVM